MTKCFICNLSIQTEHDQRDLISCLKMLSIQLEQTKSTNPNPFNLIRLKLQNKYQCRYTKTGLLKRKGEILS